MKLIYRHADLVGDGRVAGHAKSVGGQLTCYAVSVGWRVCEYLSARSGIDPVYFPLIYRDSPSIKPVCRKGHAGSGTNL